VPPAGGADTVARLLAPRLSDLLGQQVIVDNRAGGNATIGAEVVAKAPPDGHTWLLGTSQHTVTPSIVKHVPYDIVADFAPVTLVVRAPQLLMVHPSVPAKSAAELIALARKKPGHLLRFGRPRQRVASCCRSVQEHGEYQHHAYSL
jgi:tripartite-type tricarboxylate transporter receptor subunit TctC